MATAGKAAAVTAVPALFQLLTPPMRSVKVALEEEEEEEKKEEKKAEMPQKCRQSNNLGISCASLLVL